MSVHKVLVSNLVYSIAGTFVQYYETQRTNLISLQRMPKYFLLPSHIGRARGGPHIVRVCVLFFFVLLDEISSVTNARMCNGYSHSSGRICDIYGLSAIKLRSNKLSHTGKTEHNENRLEFYTLWRRLKNARFWLELCTSKGDFFFSWELVVGKRVMIRWTVMIVMMMPHSLKSTLSLSDSAFSWKLWSIIEICCENSGVSFIATPWIEWFISF